MRGSAAFRAAVAPGGVLAGPWVKNELWRRAKAVPSLDLRFAENKSLVDATTGQNLATFTRASSGTFVGSDGLLRTAVTNLRTQSEVITAANGYGVNNAALTSSAIATPISGLSTAYLFALNNGANTGNSTDGFNYGSGTTLNNTTVYTQSVFVKMSGATIFRLRSNVSGQVFDITPTSGAPAPSGSITACTVQPLGDGWYRISWTFTTTSSVPGNRADHWTIKSNVADGTSGFYVTGAQLEQSSTVGEYIPTTSVINSAPRFDHNPTTGESLGLLVEEQRTNSLLYSEQFDNAYWTKTSATVVANAIAAPNGTLTGAKLITSNTLASGRVSATVTLTIGASATLSCFAKQGESNAFTLYISDGVGKAATFNLATGTISGAPSSGLTASIKDAGSGWYKCEVSLTSAAQTSGSIRIQHTIAVGDGTSGIYIWGSQFEAGAFSTSYIPTTTATVTRSADVASISGSAFSSWYRQDEGTMFADVIPLMTPGISGQRTIVALSDGTYSNSVSISKGAGSSAYRGDIYNSGSVQAGITGASYAVGQPSRLAFGFATNDANLADNGQMGLQDSAVNLPAGLNRLDLRDQTGASLGHPSVILKRLTYWPKRLPNNVLQAITQ